MAALAIAALIPPSYRVSATLAVLPSPEFTVRAAAGSHESNASALAMDQIMKAETEILDSDELHQAAIQRIGPAVIFPDVFAPPPRNMLRRIVHAVTGTLLSPWRASPANPEAARAEEGLRAFRSHLSVLPAKDANVIKVTFDSRNGVTAAATLNAMLTLYAERRSTLYDDPQLEIVGREAERGALAVAAAERHLSEFKRDHAISDYDAQRDLLLRRRSQAEESAEEAEAAAGEHVARLTALTAQLGAEQPTIGLYTEQDADLRAQTTNTDLEAVRAKLALAREKYRETSRMVTSLRAELAAHVSEQSRLSRDKTLAVIRQGRNPTIDPLRLDRAREIGELAATRARLDSDRKSVTKLSIALAALDLDEAALAALQRERATADENYHADTRILAERHLTEAEDARRLAKVRIIQPAEIPQTPRPIALLIIAAGGMLGCFAAFGWVVVAFVRQPVFLTGEGLASATNIAVLAVFSRPLSRPFLSDAKPPPLFF